MGSGNEALSYRLLTQWERQGGTGMLVPSREAWGNAHRWLQADADAAWTMPRVGNRLPGPWPNGSAGPGAPAGVAWADGGVAETGSLILLAGPDAPRAVSLLPFRVMFLLAASDIAGRWEGWWEGHTLFPPPSAVTMISGPSRSADIENDQAIGVHGPGEVFLLILSDR